MVRSPLNTKRRSRKKRRKTKRKRRRRSIITTTIATVMAVQRSRCRTAPWRRKCPCRSVYSLWPTSYASAHVLYGTPYASYWSDTSSSLFQPMSNYTLLAENSYIKMVSGDLTAPHFISVRRDWFLIILIIMLTL